MRISNTTMDSQDVRAQFEAWCANRYDLATKKDSFGNRQYKDRWVQGAFVGWQAALAASQPVGDDDQPMVLVSQEFKSQADYDAEISSAIANMLRRNNLGLTGSAPEMVEKLLVLAARQPVGQESVSKSVGIDALVKLLADDAEECAKRWVAHGEAYASGKSAGLLAAADYFRKIATSQRWSEFLSSPAQAVGVQEAWIACGGNPGIIATREELMDALRSMNEAEDEAAQAVDLGPVIEEAIGCFNAAECEGWHEALAEGDIERIRDLWNRRIESAYRALIDSQDGE